MNIWQILGKTPSTQIRKSVSILGPTRLENNIVQRNKYGSVIIIATMGETCTPHLKILLSCKPNWPMQTKASIHQVTTMVSTSKNVLFPGHNHPANYRYRWPGTLIITWAPPSQYNYGLFKMFSRWISGIFNIQIQSDRGHKLMLFMFQNKDKDLLGIY